jgi:hypothetical protein
MKAVIWTDVLQTLVILIGLLSAIIQGDDIISQSNRSRTIFIFF